MNKFLFIFLLALVSCDTDMDKFMFEQFQKFITKYNKKYESMTEFFSRFQTFRRNLHLLTAPTGSFTTGINKNSPICPNQNSPIIT